MDFKNLLPKTMTSIDVILENDPLTIIRRLLATPLEDRETPSPHPRDTTPTGLGYLGDDESTSPSFSPNGCNESLTTADRSDTMTSRLSPSLPCSAHLCDEFDEDIDYGYDGDDDYDPRHDLSNPANDDNITPARFFFPPSPRPSMIKSDDSASSPSLCTVRSRSNESSSSSSSSSSSEDEDDVDHIIDHGRNKDFLKETAIAIRDALIDLEVVETHDRLAGDEFGEMLVEVRPRALPGGPTLVAYEDGYHQLTVPLEMGCNQRAAAAIRTILKERTINLPDRDLATRWRLHDGKRDHLDVFPSSSEVEDESGFESCEEEELMNLANSRGQKRGHDEIDSDIDDNDYDANEDGNPMKTPPNIRNKCQRLH